MLDMWVIFLDISPGSSRWCGDGRVTRDATARRVPDRCACPTGEPPVGLGVPLLDEYLRFLSGRCRPNTVFAAAYDLKVFFTVVGKEPRDVQPADVLAFVTAQRGGQASIGGVLRPVVHDAAGMSLRTVRRAVKPVG
jgi:integrase/recombinase XerD